MTPHASAHDFAPHRTGRGRPSRWIAPVCMAACSGAWAADGDFGTQALALAYTPSRSAPAIEYSSDRYPNLANPPPSDALASNGYSAGGTLQSTSVTHWMTPERPRSMGLSLGVSALTHPALGTAGAATTPLGLDMGVRWRSQLDTRRQLDVAAWTRAPQNHSTPEAMQMIWMAQQQPSFGTRVEMQWSSSRTGGLVPEFGAIGMQLESGGKVVLRAKRGKPMLYYRAKF